MTLWYVEGTFFTCGVLTDEYNMIRKTAPILHKFRGQHINRLRAWRHVERVTAL